ncbi:MAG: hypothetical protein IKU89_00020 [Oscillospiraceae bacterium]|nr:hypothetical protein [Oscillospiraceae bacterium]
MKKLLAMLLALVLALSMLSVAAFAEGGDVEVDEDVTVEENPKTGLALAVLPMVTAAAAVVFSKKN